jgi:hypothetical protein
VKTALEADLPERRVSCLAITDVQASCRFQK